MLVDDFNGERVNTEEVSDSKLDEMETDYTKYLAKGPASFYGGKPEFEHFQESHTEIRWEIASRKEEGIWTL